MLYYVGFRQYLDVEHFSSLPLKSRDASINTKVLVRFRVHGTINLQECSWEQLQKLELETVLDMPNVRNSEKQYHAERLDKLYRES